ncbi:MAG TPA: hypothetical protein PKE27_17710 [Povalibacter sp.]|uniref:hypothetical protein n=1 Tax=Povalibacter sp. TaxID=1962978 RepID=UPI002CC2B38F|nr:hypothetical protein [Povalibacter sp.]HMN46419.1 hypothetical protein [Povalibacter sp.]
MAIQPTQPQTIGGVLDTTFQLYKGSIGKVWILCLLGAIGGTLPSLYMVFGGSANPADPLAALGMMSKPGYWLANLATIILSLWSMGAVYLKVHAIGTDTDMGLGEALTTGLRKVPLLFVTGVLFGIALAVGLVLLVIPGLILMVSLMLCFNLVLFEDKGPIAALTGSHNLVWGNWWRTTAVLTVGLIIVMVIYVAVGVVLGVAIPLIGLGAGDPLMVGLISGVIIGVLASVVLTPFYVSMGIALYWDLKMRKEGGDLAARVGSLGTA